jgi:hypothetical protein
MFRDTAEFFSREAGNGVTTGMRSGVDRIVPI